MVDLGRLQSIRPQSWTRLNAQSCPTLCDPMNCSLPGSSVHGIFQARVLERVAISFSRGFSWPRDQTQAKHCRQMLCRLSHQGSPWLNIDVFLLAHMLRCHHLILKHSLNNIHISMLSFSHINVARALSSISEKSWKWADESLSSVASTSDTNQ